MQGIVIGEGDMYQEALEDLKSAIAFHLESFGKKDFQGYDLITANIAEVPISLSSS